MQEVQKLVKGVQRKEIVLLWMANYVSLEKLLRDLLTAPLDLTIDNDSVGLFKGLGALSIPLRYCTKSDKNALHALLRNQYHEKNLFRVQINLSTFRIKYDKFARMDEVEQAVNRVFLVGLVFKILKKWFPVSSSTSRLVFQRIVHLCEIELANVTAERGAHHPLSTGLRKILANPHIKKMSKKTYHG